MSQPNRNLGIYIGIYVLIGLLGTLGATMAAWLVLYAYDFA
jgi:hypothetical protein